MGDFDTIFGMKRKIYDELVKWKRESADRYALLLRVLDEWVRVGLCVNLPRMSMRRIC